MEEAEGQGLAQHGEEMALGGPYSSLPLPMGKLMKRWSQAPRDNGGKLKWDFLTKIFKKENLHTG